MHLTRCMHKHCFCPTSLSGSSVSTVESSILNVRFAFRSGFVRRGKIWRLENSTVISLLFSSPPKPKPHAWLAATPETAPGMWRGRTKTRLSRTNLHRDCPSLLRARLPAWGDVVGLLGRLLNPTGQGGQ